MKITKKAKRTTERPQRTGYIPRKPDPKAHVLGDASIPFPIINPSGQWDDYLPAFESQIENGYDPRDCVSEAYTSCQEMLERKLYKTAPEYSERFLAQISGTERKGGNSLHDVAEMARKVGLIDESEWPSHGIPQEDFYDQPPPRLYGIARADHDMYERLHKDVPATKEAIEEALKRSPLSFAIFAWAQRPDGIYYEPAGVQDTHCPVIYGYTDEYVKVFDSAEPFLKRVAWDAIDGEIKVYAIRIAPPTRSILAELEHRLRVALAFLATLVDPATPPIQPVAPPLAPDPIPEPPLAPIRDLLAEFCEAIADYEGGPSDLNYRNNNPGNLRQWHTQKGTRNGFAYFETWDQGMDALKELVTRAASGKSSVYKPTMTIEQFFSKYAPAEDHNDPKRYAAYVARRIGVDLATFRIRELL